MMAMEAYDAETESMAMESLNGDIVDISNDLQPKMNEAASRYTLAVANKQYDDALNALNDIEAISRTWKARLSALPPEAKSKTIIRTTIKIIATIAACMLIIRSKLITAKAINMLARMGVSISIGGKVVNVAMFIAGSYSWSRIFSAIAEALTALCSKKKDPRKEAYKDDPNAHNANYLGFQMQLDQWIDAVQDARAEIRKEQAEAAKK